jgi:outer membrane receptor protein involved in Fe transport
VDAWIYDRVELVGGPSSLINGDGSVGGSLNYVTNEVYVEFAHASPTYYLGTPRMFELAVQTRL